MHLFSYFTQHYESSQGIQQPILELNVSFSNFIDNFHLSQQTAAHLLFHTVDDSIVTQNKSYLIAAFDNSFSQTMLSSCFSVSGDILVNPTFNANYIGGPQDHS